jgi:predicted Zn-dependent protease
VPPPRAIRASLAPARALLAAVLACAAPQQRFEDVNGPEGLIEVLPRDARIEVDGAPLGAGAATLPVTDRRRVHAVVVRAPGFEVLETRVPAEQLAVSRVGLALRPQGFGSARPLDMDEPSGLAAAAALLLRAGRDRDAAEYAARAVELAPDSPGPRRLLGDAYLRSGRRERALQEYAAFLAHAPRDGPERAEVERQVAALRGDLAMPEAKR